MDALMKDTNIFYNVLCFLITENEKLFDRSDARLYWQTVFHMLCIYHHSLVGLFAMGINLYANDSIELDTLRKYRPAYLTGWNFILQTIFLILALGYDTLQWLDKHETDFARKLKYYRDIIFSGLVVPVTMFVTAMFWSIYLVDRELVFPTVYDDIVPWWFNHCVHTNIFIVIVVETLLQSRRRPVNEKLETICCVTCVVLYAVVYYSIYFFGHRWLYGVFGIMTWWQVCLFQLLIWGSSYCFYRVQFPLNRLVHGSDNEPDCQKNGDVPENCSIATIHLNVKPNNKHNGTNADKDKPQVNGQVNAALTNLDDEIPVVSNKRNEGNGAVNVAQTSLSNASPTLSRDLQKPPFADKTWSVKYKNIRRQFENSSL